MLINYQNNAFGKFIIDKNSLKVFEDKLWMIEDSSVRKHIYQLLGDMLIDNDVSGN
jgi:predicted DNA-binding protein YlxM (UPF0122 family)